MHLNKGVFEAMPDLRGRPTMNLRKSLNILFKPSCQLRGMADNHTMAAILSAIRRKDKASRMQMLSRPSEPTRVSETEKVVEPARLPDPTRDVDYRWEGTRALVVR